MLAEPLEIEPHDDGMGFLPRCFATQPWELSREWMALHRSVGTVTRTLGARTLGTYLPVLLWTCSLWLARRRAYEWAAHWV
jgi:hypothetical protein